VRKNVLALSIFADVIRAVLEALKGAAWASPSTLKIWFLSRRLPGRLGTARNTQAGSPLTEKSKRGSWEALGSQRSNRFRNICEQTQSRGRNQERRKRARNPLDYVLNKTYLEKRDGKVRKHSPTAKPSATVDAVARDLFEIVCTLLNCASNAQGCVRLASSAYLLRRFALTCKEGARAY